MVLNVVIGRSLSLDVVVCPMFLHGNSWMCDSPEKHVGNLRAHWRPLLVQIAFLETLALAGYC